MAGGDDELVLISVMIRLTGSSSGGGDRGLYVSLVVIGGVGPRIRGADWEGVRIGSGIGVLWEVVGGEGWSLMLA